MQTNKQSCAACDATKNIASWNQSSYCTLSCFGLIKNIRVDPDKSQRFFESSSSSCMTPSPNGKIMEINERTRLLMGQEDFRYPSSSGGTLPTPPASPLTVLFEKPGTKQEVSAAAAVPALPSLVVPSVTKRPEDGQPNGSSTATTSTTCFQKNNNATTISLQDVKNTMTGSIVFLLYHVVFCLAQASTITRPHSDHSSTCVMAKLAALGVFTAGPLFVWELGDTVPAIYPASDLFLAPFLAQLAATIDTVLYEQNLQNDDAVFLATFGVVMGVGFVTSGLLCILAARVKLANLGAFLPYSVLCGFFTTIGILIWTLGFSVDVGMKVGEVVKSGNVWVMANALYHHMPSLLIGIVMHIFGPRNPLLVVLLVISTILGSYVVLWITGTTLEQAQEANWFFSAKDLEDNMSLSSTDSTTISHYYGPAAPFGLWQLILNGYVCWDACIAAMPTMLSLVFLYLVRSSLHSAALKKNIPNVTRTKKEPSGDLHSSSELHAASNPTLLVATSSRSDQVQNNAIKKKKKKPPASLNYILEHGYGYTQILSGLAGGITVAPSVAASLTLFKLGAEANAPQYGSCILLVLIFYLSNFTLVQYIPKPAFSCLMVLAGLDMCRTWIYDSYYKTKAKLEWLVGPLLVLLAFSIGVLNAIFCGVACSTFIFVAKFYNAGAVKYVGNGLTLRSTVERGMKEVQWLDQNGDLIQILVVQNYLFFGNSQSLLTYITTMFEDDMDETNDMPQGQEQEQQQQQSSLPPQETPLPPLPKYLVVEFTLVTGMDTSAVDNIREIAQICQTHQCKLFLAGLNPKLKSSLLYAGIKSSAGSNKKYLAYTSDMETALAKAEDQLLSNVFHLEEKNETESSNRRQERRRMSSGTGEDDGFCYALQKIDEQHGLQVAEDLKGFRSYSQAVELEPGDVLVRDNDKGGLYFVETGLMRVQWAPGNSTRNFTNLTLKGPQSQLLAGFGGTPYYDYVGAAASSSNEASIGHMNARSRKIGLEAAIWKQTHTSPNEYGGSEQSFRLARIGQGWVIGGIEAANGMKKPGVHVAITSCRLHYLPESAVLLAEEENPKLAMSLYKMISHLATKRQEMTIGHLGQHLRILNNPVPRLRGGGKAALVKIQNGEDPFGA